MMPALLFVAATFAGGQPVPPAPPRPVVVAVTTTIPAPPASPRPVVLAPGHYTCYGPQADRYSTVGGCSLDPGGDPGPNLGSDRPEDTAAGRDPEYSARLDAETCVAIPVLCSVDSGGHYR